MSQALTGGCMCGAVRYEVAEKPERAGYCHCKRCQRRSGTAASISAQVAGDALRIVSGEELVRTWWPDSGWGKAFCSECGSALWSVSPHEPRDYGVRMGTFDDDTGVRAQWHQWLSSAAAFEPIPDDGLPRFEERRT